MIPLEKVAFAATRKTPRVLLERGKILIMGRSISENPGDFFRPIHDWVSRYVGNPDILTEIELGFEYINTSSVKWVYAILKELTLIKNSIAHVKVIWNYEKGDDDLRELGIILRSIIDCPFSIVEVISIKTRD